MVAKKRAKSTKKTVKTVKKVAKKSVKKKVTKTTKKPAKKIPKATNKSTKRSVSTKPDQELLRFIRLAIDTEVKGIKFYTNVRDKINDFNMKKLMNLLIEQEKVHLRTFEQMYSEEVDKHRAANVAIKYTGVGKIPNPMFPLKKISRITGKRRRINHALKQAIDFEVDGYEMYIHMAKKVKNKRIKEFLLKVAEEELHHRDFLHMYHDIIYDTGYWMGLEHVRLET